MDICGEVDIPDSIKTKHDVDFILLITVTNKPKPGRYVDVYSGICLRDTNHNGRPVLARLVFNPE
jgi:hypothetical protein